MNIRALLVLFVLSLYCTHAMASSYAILIGQNQGRAYEPLLQYAEDDASKLGKALRKVGGFEASNITLLFGEKSQRVRRVIEETNARLRSENDPNSRLIVFYSGHADAEELHFGDESLTLEEVRDLVKGSAAGLRLLVVDACRSGALTTGKGGVVKPAFEVNVQAPSTEGFVVLTSASAGENAHESPAVQGSFFSHHLTSGLLGAADKDGDARITLEELTSYAYVQTVKQSAQTMAGTQHPRFVFDIKGSDQLVLSTLRARENNSVLTLPKDFSWMIMKRGDVVAELPRSADARRLALDAGTYSLLGRGDDALFEGEITLARGEEKTANTASMKRTEFTRLVRKGGERKRAHFLSLGYRGRTSVHAKVRACHGMRLGYGLQTRFLLFHGGVAGCLNGWSNRSLRAHQQELALDAGVSYVVDFPLVFFSLGLGGGASLFRQSFDTRGEADDRLSTLPFAELKLNASTDIVSGWLLSAGLSGRSYAIADYVSAGKSAFASPLVLVWSVGVAKQF